MTGSEGSSLFFTAKTQAEREGNAMPMIDIYAVAGTFADPKHLAIEAATTVKTIEFVTTEPRKPLS